MHDNQATQKGIDMTTITQAVRIATSRNADYWLQQVNRNLPYGNLTAMIDTAIAEGSTVTQISHNRFLVNHSAWVTAHGCVQPL
jgi:hypothetical protein